MTINLKIPDIRELKPRITVFGVGGAGGNAVNNMISAGLLGVDFVVANTDAQALTLSKAERIIQMGAQVTEGLGAGSQPDIGQMCIRDRIGWAPVTLTDAGRASVLAPLRDIPVLHWHGDNCELPTGCTRLASTPHCPVQAFARTPSQLALQFHLETEPARFESWLVGHTVELGKAGVDPRQLRTQARTVGPATRELGQKVLAAWLDKAAA